MGEPRIWALAARADDTPDRRARFAWSERTRAGYSSSSSASTANDNTAAVHGPSQTTSAERRPSSSNAISPNATPGPNVASRRLRSPAGVSSGRRTLTRPSRRKNIESATSPSRNIAVPASKLRTSAASLIADNSEVLRPSASRTPAATSRSAVALAVRRAEQPVFAPLDGCVVIDEPQDDRRELRVGRDVGGAAAAMIVWPTSASAPRARSAPRVPVRRCSSRIGNRGRRSRRRRGWKRSRGVPSLRSEHEVTLELVERDRRPKLLEYLLLRRRADTVRSDLAAAYDPPHHRLDA